MENPPSTEKTGPRAGDVIDGNLEIEAVIAEGMTSTVVSARDKKSGARVAVKIARGSDLESTERFRRAARAMSKLTSPYAVHVISVGETHYGQPCMSMEYLEGKTLAAKLLQQGPLPLDEAVRYVIQAVEAVTDAHGKGLLHRDLDAENLFLAMPPRGSSEPPSVRVLDFGLSPIWRLNKGDGRLKPGDVGGTSFALAPELARGADIDDRADIWGAGSCLFRLLTNRYPFNARNLAELCTRVLSERPPDLSKMRPQVTLQLAAVVKRCLEREPGDRYPSMAALLDALRDTLDEAPNTPQVPTGNATLEQLREMGAMTLRDTPRVMKVGGSGVVPSADIESDDDDTSVFGKAHLAPTPHTVRIVPAFEALANQLEPHQRKPERANEDGPSTQPLGRLSPFAELPKRGSGADASDRPPPFDQEESIVPQLVPVSDAFAPPKIQSQPSQLPPPPLPPLPKPSAAVMAMETAPPPPLPKPSAATAAAETMQGPGAPPVERQVVFTATPRTLAILPASEPKLPLPTPPPPPPPPYPYPSPNPIGGVSGPPPPYPFSPPAAPISEPELAVHDTPPKRRRSAVIPLLFALALAASIVIGLYIAKVVLPSKPIASTSPPSAAPPSSSTSTVAIKPPPREDAAPPEIADAGEGETIELRPSPSTSSHHRVHHPRPPRPPPSASPPTSASAHGGSIYDPNQYDPK